MSSSYFDAQPSRASAPGTTLHIPEGSEFARTGLLSPQVSRILDNLDLDDKSSSGDDSSDNSHDDHHASRSRDHKDPNIGASGERKSRRDLAEQKPPRKVQTTPSPGSRKSVQNQGQPSTQRPGLNSQSGPHFARFHSLRSMLFSSRIEDSMKKHNEAQTQEQAELKWKAEHDLRKGLNRPKTPEEQSPSKEGLGQRMKMGLRRMTSKNSPPPMKKIEEDNISTASDDEQDQTEHSDEENIKHSDIEDLVRWISKRDPPSDGEPRKASSEKPFSKTDSGHGSLGNSDVEELVRWVSRKDEPQTSSLNNHLAPPTVSPHNGYSDASTASDSERDAVQNHHKDSMDDEDVDELVRWVSRREGPDAGPVRGEKSPSTTSLSNTSNTDADELSRWMTKHDDTSGESLAESAKDLPAAADSKVISKTAPQTGSRLKREVSHTKPVDEPAAMKSDAALTDGHVDELVRWVSQRKAATPKVEE